MDPTFDCVLELIVGRSVCGRKWDCQIHNIVLGDYICEMIDLEWSL